MLGSRAGATEATLVVVALLVSACLSKASIEASASPSTGASPDRTSRLPSPSLDVAARDRIDAACLAADRDYATRGGTPTISAGTGYALLAGAEQGGLWVLLYGNGTSYVTCMQKTRMLGDGLSDFSLGSPEPWTTDPPGGALRSCTNYAQVQVFFCVGKVEPAAAEVIVDNPPDASVRVIPDAEGHFVVSFPYAGMIRSDGRLGDRVQVSFVDACGQQFHLVRMAGPTPCPRTS